MSESKYFNKIRITDIKDAKITAINLHKNYLIIGYVNGAVHIYEINSKNKLSQTGEIITKNKIDQLIVLSHLNICLILTAGELLAANIPSLNNKTQLIKSGVEKVFINLYNKECINQIIVITKKKKLKIYDINNTQNNISLTDSKSKEINIEEIPNCGEWVNNNLIYSNTSKTFWLDLNSGKSSPVELQGILQIFNLKGKIGLVNSDVTIFMKDGKSFPYKPILQPSKDFLYFTVFKNYLIGLYKNSVNIFKKGEQSCDLIETIELDKNDGQGKFIISSENKLIISSDIGNKSYIINFQEKPYEEQVKFLIEEKKYNDALEKLVDNVSEDDENKQEIIEKFYLDCAWNCIKGENKQYDLAIKFLNLANFNPYEFIYMFYDSLCINIVHLDKKKDILEHIKDNQLISTNSSSTEEDKKHFIFLINVLITKRDYILNRYKLTSSEN